MTWRMFLAAGFAASATLSIAAAEETVVSERTLTQPTGSWQYHGVTPEQLKGFIDQHKARIIDLEVNDGSPLKMSAALVANSGPHASGWWWYHSLTGAQVKEKIDEHKARLIDIEPYSAGGQIRFAIVLKPNKGADATGWWWYWGQTPEQLKDKLDEHKARLIDLERYRDGGKTLYAAIMVSNEGAKSTGWWWYRGQTGEQVGQLVKKHKARILDLERYGAGAKERFDIVLVSNGGADAVGWWWSYGTSPERILELSRRHGARLVDIEPPAEGASGYAGVMIDNGMTRTGDCGGPFKKLERRIVDWMKLYEIPGGAAAVVKDGRLLYACAFGFADLESGREATLKDRFRIASVSKPLTAAAIRKLAADGKISLGDKMLDRLGSAKPPEPYASKKLDDITIQHLLDHKGGWNTDKLGYDPMGLTDKIAKELGTSRPPSCEDIVRWMFQKVKLNFTPGEGIDDKDYSNFGYCILGLIIEAQSGKSYERYVQDAILEPIRIEGMKIGGSRKSGASEATYYDKPFAAAQTSIFDAGPKSGPRPYVGLDLDAMEAHGGWIATALDLARFVAFADPYGSGGNWGHGGEMTGNYAWAQRMGDVSVAFVFNGNPAAKKVEPLFEDASLGVTKWPTQDLWSKYGYPPRRKK